MIKDAVMNKAVEAAAEEAFTFCPECRSGVVFCPACRSGFAENAQAYLEDYMVSL